MEIEKKTILSVLSAVEDAILNDNKTDALREIAIFRKELNKEVKK